MELYANVDAFRTYEGALYCLQCGKPYTDEKKRCIELAEIARKEANTPSRVVPYKPSGFGVHPDNLVANCNARIESIAGLLSPGSGNIPTLAPPSHSGV